MCKAILKTANLTIGYRHKKQQTIISDNITMDLHKGKMICLLGRNGVGKSTLLRTLSKVQKPLSGTIFINDKNLSDFTNLELSKTLSLVLTERLPESQLTVFELVALGRQPYTNWVDNLNKEDIKKINTALELTETKQLQNNRFYELSDGQLQRVLIARALAQDTELVILDEPTAHLDIHHTFKVFSLLKELVKKTKKTIIISTHEVNLAIKLADEFVLLSENKIFSGTSEELIQQKAFETLFPKELIFFDDTTKQFVIR